MTRCTILAYTPPYKRLGLVWFGLGWFCLYFILVGAVWLGVAWIFCFGLFWGA